MSDPHPTATPDLARTPLDDLHRSLGARMVPFAGYAMPVQYSSGIIVEHLHTRNRTGLFDVSHMGQATLRGPNAGLGLESLVPGAIATLGPGRMRYTQLLDADGHILDDLMVTRLADDESGERLRLVVNAGTKAGDFAHLATHLPDLTLEIHHEQALLALQGPSAATVLSRFLPGVETMPFMSARDFASGGVSLQVSRSGYTGEDGFEISISADAATAFAQALLGQPEVLPIGLGARDSLRLEAGLCLYGHDIDRTTDPVEAGLLWSIAERRRAEGGFLGADAIRRVVAEGSDRKRVGLLLDGKAPAREGSEIVTPEGQAIGQVIGHVTSGGFSPCLGRAIAMGYINAAFSAADTLVHLVVRGKPLTAKLAPLPFVPHHYYRGA